MPADMWAGSEFWQVTTNHDEWYFFLHAVKTLALRPNLNLKPF